MPAMSRCLPAVLGSAVVCAVLLVPAPRAAHAAASVDGYVWVDRASESSYPVTNSYRYNSTGGDIQVERPSAGVYAVRFVGMGVPGGVAHARPYGSLNTAICTIVSWTWAGGDEVVNVRCFDATGTPADTRFTASFTNRATGLGTFGYLWANQASPALGVSYTPSASYAYDSTGVTAQVWRQDVGVYMMTMGAVDAHYPLDHRDGVYQITAYNHNPVRCEVHGENDETPTPIGVFCADQNGTPTDTRFSVTYAHSVSLQGTGTVAANAHFSYFSDDPATWFGLGYWNSGGAPSITRFAAGRYRVSFPGLALLAGHAVAGARGNPFTYCLVAWWSANTVDVHCFDRVTDTPVDSEFNVAMTA
jgi:hypothetical protein